MSKKFDLTPLLKKGYGPFLKLPLAAGLIVCAGVWGLGCGGVAFSLLRGCVLGLADGAIMLKGIKKALPFKDEPQKGLAIMRRYRWYRVAAASAVIILLLKQGSAVTGVFIGLLLMHIFFIINMIFIAYRLDKEET